MKSKYHHKLFIMAGLLLVQISISQADDIPISQTPLIAAGGAPDNLVILPSVEFPTVNSVSNIDAEYNINTVYGGYFDSDKCYQYHYEQNEERRHFYPVNWANNHACDGYKMEWSGNFLNWAATQTIDPFRSAMTGGYRVVDTPTETWLEKARQDGQGGDGYFPNRRLEGHDNLTKSIPRFQVRKKITNVNADVDYIQMRIHGLGNRMYINFNGNNVALGKHEAFNPDSKSFYAKTIYELSIRVKVCVNGLLEANCKQYDSAYKPEGLMQEYASRLRYSVFGYLNDTRVKRDGAVLRARQKSIGPKLASTSEDTALLDNPDKEWDPDTGVLKRNPDANDANKTNQEFGLSIQDSGAINYINKFGQLTTNEHKGIDPVSEMFYAGTRYLRNLPNVRAYSDMSDQSQENKQKFADGFPVITDWQDPYVAYCQTSAFLGIGDVFTHRDKNLPGNTTHRADEPAMPASVAADSINVIKLSNKVGQLEGLGDIGDTFTNRYRKNSSYIAGLAWYANTHDIRPDLKEKQTVATFWVDVLEGQSLLGMAQNPYALAAKYGGFRVPENFNPTTRSEALPDDWWHTNHEIITPFGEKGKGQASFKRPDNYFTAGEANQMAHSLKQAFARIIARVNGSGIGLAANTTRLEAGARVYQAIFYNKSWHGELKALEVDYKTGKLSPKPAWLASENIPNWKERKIMLGDKTFKWDNLETWQKQLLDSEALVNYLRGDNSNEQRSGGKFRDRYITVLGDIVHSQAIMASKPNPDQFRNYSFSGSSAYPAFAKAQINRPSVLYVGANDGMLHGFNAQDGKEIYAFIPNEAIRNGLKKTSHPAYRHKYFVDGELTIADAYLNGQWKTILVGTMGRGGKSIFALDITAPDNIKFLWEKTANDIPEMGYILSKPIITQTDDGKWKVAFGNGVNSKTGYAQLILIDLANQNVEKINTNIGGNNGLNGITAWSNTNNAITDVFYAGDFKGNLWEIALNKSPRKIFQAKAPNSHQPQTILAAPLIGINPDNQALWAFFGTGQYLSQIDLTDKSKQTWYGVKIQERRSDRDNMVERKLEIEGEKDSLAVRVIESGTEKDLEGKDGWYMNLPDQGERMIVENIFQQDVLIGTVRIPDTDDICKPTGRGFVIAIKPFTGGRLDRIFFDTNDDTEFDDKDNLVYQEESLPISGFGFESSPNAPIFIGNTMQVVEDNGNTHSILTQGLGSTIQRTSWREIFNQ
ncbi:MAG: hypothetical protein CR991_09355 [Proteobacteria bacterium]|nr:MAG: hypothetical protein CR991_09355 [Pseudomonadota bacterium]